MKTCKYKDCNNPVFGGGYCKWHQGYRTDMKKSPPKKRKPFIRAVTGELELFKEIWNERPHISEMSGIKIPMFDIRCFHHILTKQAYPQYRLVKENIVILTRHEHATVHAHSWDNLIEKDNRWKSIHQKYLDMKQYGKETNL